MQVVKFGMSKVIGPVSFQMPEPGEMVLDKPYSEETAQMIDKEVRTLVNDALVDTRKLLREKKDLVCSTQLNKFNVRCSGGDRCAATIGKGSAK